MLVRCEKCNQLYPEHHGECRQCRDGVVPSKFKTGELPPMALRSRTGDLAQQPRPSTGELTSRGRTGNLSPQSHPVTSNVSPQPRPSTGNLTPSSDKKEDASNTEWQAGVGGLCPQCGYYNEGNLAFCFSCNAMLVRSTEKVAATTSYSLKDVKGLLGTFVQNLAKLNIKTTADILTQCAGKLKRSMIASKTQLSERSLLRLVHIADLCRVPDIDPEKAAMLELVGVTDLKGFLLQTPDKLAAKLQQNKALLNKQGILVLPIAKHLETWLNDARQLAPLKIDP